MRDRRRVRRVDSEAFRAGLFGERCQLFDIAGPQANPETGRCQSAGDRCADAWTRADDQCGAIGNGGHGQLLMLALNGGLSRQSVPAGAVGWTVRRAARSRSHWNTT